MPSAHPSDPTNSLINANKSQWEQFEDKTHLANTSHWTQQRRTESSDFIFAIIFLIKILNYGNPWQAVDVKEENFTGAKLFDGYLLKTK